MSGTKLDLNPVDFITIGTIGPKGKRIFHLQAGHNDRLVSFLIEKEQAWALSDAIREFLADLDERDSMTTSVEMAGMDMDLREPIQPMFPVGQLGLAYDDDEDKVILIAQKVTDSEAEDEEEDPDVVRMWCTRRQMKALGLHALDIVEQGRPSPKQNGRITYYWT
jgi:uncharacterized repeat protein (TIGR03847 family)